MNPWMHAGKRPRYMAAPSSDAKPVAEHEPDPTYNAQGDWICHSCGELVRYVGRRVEVAGGVMVVDA